MSPIRVLIVDDSALIRQLLSSLLGQEDDIEVVGVAADPLKARSMIKSLNPDVLTLDVEMPKMDGLSFLQKIMTLRPMPVVMVSGLTQIGAETTIKALELGAVDFFAKPTIDLQDNIQLRANELIEKVRAAANANVQPIKPPHSKHSAQISSKQKLSQKIIAIGASTGGVEAIGRILSEMPGNCPPILIAQHMPAAFTKSFANRLNDQSAMVVKEAAHLDVIQSGHVYIAPGDKHLTIAKSAGKYMCRLADGPEVSGHRPSVDVLMKSIAMVAGRDSVGGILTGMGRDGADGLMAMNLAGAATFGQDEASSIVYGMPKAAFMNGAVDVQLNLSVIAAYILQLSNSGKETV